MTNVNEILDISQNHLIGKVIVSSVSKGRILDIKMPEENSVITVTANDFIDKSCKILEDFIPILAHDSIEYLHQPVLAVFGPDSETVDMFCSQIEIVVDTSEKSRKKMIESKPVPYTWTSGDVSKYFTKEAKIVESDFTVASEGLSLISNERILANFVDDCLYIKTATQWPMHAKETVSSALGLSRSQVKLYTKTFRADFDQLLIVPSLCSAVVAAAAKKSGYLCELFIPTTSWQPETVFHRSTVISAEGKPLAEKISVVADFGAYPIFRQEAQYNILAGLIPAYELNAVEVNITIKKSTREPASFFNDLGYGTAVAFTEHHCNKIAKEVNKSPYEWRVENLAKVSLISEKIRRCITYEALQSTLDECATDSWFNRKHSVYSQSRFTNQKVSPIAGYAKGIGLACAHGIAGFSEKYTYAAQSQLTITYTEEQKAYVNIGFVFGEDTKTSFRDFIADRLNINSNDVHFLDVNTDKVRDFGPSVLSRSVAVVPRLLDNACAGITKKIKMGKPLPIVQQVFYSEEKDRPFFDANTFGSVCISLHIDPVKVVPVIDSITARLKFGKVFAPTVLARRIRQIICTTISQVCPCAENNANVDLKVKSNPHLPTGSCSSMLRGITAAALATAISQALGHEMTSFPISDEDVVNIVQMKKPAEEKTDEA